MDGRKARGMQLGRSLLDENRRHGLLLLGMISFSIFYCYSIKNHKILQPSHEDCGGPLLRLNFIEVDLVLASVAKGHNTLVTVVDSAHVKHRAFVHPQILKLKLGIPVFVHTSSL